MNQIKNDSSALRKALAMDSAATGAMGLGLVLAGGVLSQPLGISDTVLQLAGGLLLPFTGLLVYLACQRVAPAGLTWLVILGNALWVVASVWVLVTRWVQPTPLGTTFIVAQAAAVGVFALLELRGLRQARTSPALTVGL